MTSLSSCKVQPDTPLEGEVLPFEGKLITLTQREHIELKHSANYWKALHSKACTREEKLKKKLEEKLAIIRDLNQRLYGKSSESSSGQDKAPDSDSPAKEQPTKRPRGQQTGAPSHGRTQRPDLPVKEETIKLNEACCPHCAAEYIPFPGYEESGVIEIEVRAYTRKIKRQRAKKTCQCASIPAIITAPVAPKLIPKSLCGTSIWEYVLLGKFLYAQPLHRILQDLNSYGLKIAQGTVTGGLKKLAPIFNPIHQEIHAHQMTETIFHNDESRWEVYEPIEGKTGHRWYLWVTKSQDAVYFCIDPTRAAVVPLRHFANVASDQVIVICDRYSAYKKLARLNPSIILAFCWVHVRRDFLTLSRSHKHLKDWGLDWVDTIGTLYHINNQRVEQWNPELTIAEQSTDFQQHHTNLKEKLEQMKSRAALILQDDVEATKSKEPSDKKLETIQRKVLTSLHEHWYGLIVFLEYVQVPMDNNPAERTIRNPVIGRKNYYGSGSIWSAELAAMMFSIFQTLILWGINPRTWLRCYLEVCERNNGQPPEDLAEFLPWKMDETRRQQLIKPPSYTEHTIEIDTS